MEIFLECLCLNCFLSWIVNLILVEFCGRRPAAAGACSCLPDCRALANSAASLSAAWTTRLRLRPPRTHFRPLPLTLVSVCSHPAECFWSLFSTYESGLAVALEILSSKSNSFVLAEDPKETCAVLLRMLLAFCLRTCVLVCFRASLNCIEWS